MNGYSVAAVAFAQLRDVEIGLVCVNIMSHSPLRRGWDEHSRILSEKLRCQMDCIKLIQVAIHQCYRHNKRIIIK